MIRRRVLPVAALAAGLAACAAPHQGAGPARPVLATPAAAGTAPTRRASTTLRTSTTASTFSFTLPAGVAWVADGDRRVASGARIRRWRFQPGGHSPACVVTAGELPNYHGAFPAAELAAFVGSRESGSEVIRNESITPPTAGTIAEIRQEQSFVSRVAEAGTVRSHLYVRQALTTAHTLVAVYAAGPDNAAGTCRPRDATESLIVASPTGGSSPTTGGTP
jgi:hypothetical protein